MSRVTNSISKDGIVHLDKEEAAIVFHKNGDVEIVLCPPDNLDKSVPSTVLYPSTIVCLLKESEEFRKMISDDMETRWRDDEIIQ